MNLLLRPSKQITFLALGLLGLEILWVVYASIPWLLGQVNADDFYYYLVLARNNAAGYGPTFDGTELTNGFHPLYFLLLTLLAKLPVDNPAFLIKSSLILLLFFHTATGVVIELGFKLRGRPDIGQITALSWLLNPWPLAITLHGVEAPIATFLWVLVIFGVISYRQERGRLELKQAIILGLLAGLAILARTDGLLLLAAIMVTELWRAWRERGPGRKQLIAGVIVMGVGAFIVTLPWWWWNWQTFNMIIQVSGKAIFLGTHGFDWLHPPLILAKVSAAAQGYLSRLILYTIIPLLLLGFAFWQHFKQRQPGQHFFQQTLRELDFALLAVLALTVWYPGWQWNFQNWYLLSSIAVVTIAVGVAWQHLSQKYAPLNIKQAAGLVVMVSFLILAGIYSTTGFGFPRQTRGYDLAQWLNQHTEPDAIVGSWNSGIIGYFTRRQVINLDGVVNNSLYHYKVAHQISDPLGVIDYAKSRGINYLTDYENFFIGNAEELGLQLIYESPDYDNIRIYRLN